MILVPGDHGRFFLGRRLGNSVTFMFWTAGVGLKKIPKSRCVVLFWSVTTAVGITGWWNSPFLQSHRKMIRSAGIKGRKNEQEGHEYRTCCVLGHSNVLRGENLG